MQITKEKKIHFTSIESGFDDFDRVLLEQLLPQLEHVDDGYCGTTVYNTFENTEKLMDLINGDLGIELAKADCSYNNILDITSNHSAYLNEITCSDDNIQTAEVIIYYTLDKYVDIIEQERKTLAAELNSCSSDIRRQNGKLFERLIKLGDFRVYKENDTFSTSLTYDCSLKEVDFEFIEFLRVHKYFRSCTVTHHNEMRIKLTKNISGDIKNESK